MAGLLTHLTIALVGFLIGTFIFKNYRFGLAFLIGSLIPDLLDFGLAGIQQGSLDPSVIMTNQYFRPLAIFGHTFWHWIAISLLVFLIILWFYNQKRVSKKVLENTFIAIIFFLLGVGIHILIADVLIIETSYWI